MRTLALALPLALLTACGGAKTATTNTTITTNTQTAATGDSAFDRGFKSSFRTKFVESCNNGAHAAAAKAGNAKMASADFTPLCGCAADKLLATKSPTELATGVPQADQIAVTQQCAKEHPIT